MQFNYTDEHLVPEHISGKHDLPQAIHNWINSDAQPKPFDFRDDIVPSKEGKKPTEGMEVLRGTMYGEPDDGNPSVDSGLHYLELDLPWDIPYKEMHKEADSFKEHYVPHRSMYEHHGRFNCGVNSAVVDQHGATRIAPAVPGWGSLCIHGLSAVQTQYHDRYGFIKDDVTKTDLHPFGTPMEDKDVPYIWTDICKYMPTIAKFFQEVFSYQVYARIRIMQLAPGGFIYPHTDWDMHTIGPVNIALNNPDGCKFYVKGRGCIPYKPGSAIKLDIGFDHALFNDSDEYRYHMIIHGWPGNSMEPWNSIFYNSYKKMIRENMARSCRVFN